ncbi:MAG: regulatory protein RecX [Candidatus Omnitrophica bacterium]|nr:regulatory protein RecX [Candidatus Omnitrophota bacterium]
MLSELESAKNFALRLIKFRTRSKYELLNRLKRKHYPEEIIKQVLDLLTNLGYVDDLTFAKAWVNGRLHFKPRSRKLLAYELKNKGIEETIIEGCLAGLNSKIEEQIASKLVQKKILKFKGLSRETKKRRLIGYLSRRGFSGGISYKIINELEEL